MKRTIFARLVVLTALFLIIAGAVPADPSLPDPAPLLGGAKYFFCLLGQTLKVGGLLTLQPEIVLAGAIVGGIACGFGW